MLWTSQHTCRSRSRRRIRARPLYRRQLTYWTAISRKLTLTATSSVRSRKTDQSKLPVNPALYIVALCLYKLLLFIGVHSHARVSCDEDLALGVYLPQLGFLRSHHATEPIYTGERVCTLRGSTGIYAMTEYCRTTGVTLWEIVETLYWETGDWLVVSCREQLFMRPTAGHRSAVETQGGQATT